MYAGEDSGKGQALGGGRGNSCIIGPEGWWGEEGACLLLERLPNTTGQVAVGIADERLACLLACWKRPIAAVAALLLQAPCPFTHRHQAFSRAKAHRAGRGSHKRPPSDASHARCSTVAAGWLARLAVELPASPRFLVSSSVRTGFESGDDVSPHSIEPCETHVLCGREMVGKTWARASVGGVGGTHSVEQIGWRARPRLTRVGRRRGKRRTRTTSALSFVSLSCALRCASPPPLPHAVSLFKPVLYRSSARFRQSLCTTMGFG